MPGIQEAKSYYKEYVQYESSEYSFLEEFNFAGCKVLDLGCGVGEALFFINKLFMNIDGLGIDISENSISCAKGKNSFHNLKFHNEDLFSVLLPDDQFDFILSFGVLHYYSHKDMNLILNKIVKSLKSDGKIILFLFKPHLLHFARRVIQRILYFTGGIKLLEKIKDDERKNVIMNILNPPVFHMYSQKDIMEIADKNQLKVVLIKNKPSHIMHYLFPFYNKLSSAYSSILYKSGIINCFSFGNYYVLEKQPR